MMRKEKRELGYRVIMVFFGRLDYLIKSKQKFELYNKVKIKKEMCKIL